MLAVSAVTVLGRPDGAPIDACSNGLVPGHPSPPNMANGSVPFYVNISNFGGYYMPEETYTSECASIKILYFYVLTICNS